MDGKCSDAEILIFRSKSNSEQDDCCFRLSIRIPSIINSTTLFFFCYQQRLNLQATKLRFQLEYYCLGNIGYTHLETKIIPPNSTKSMTRAA